MKNLLIFFLLILLSLPAVKDLFKPGAFTSHDLTHHIVRTIQMDKILAEGQIPPRWTGNLNFGYGYPIFIFMYPLPQALASLVHRFGFDYIWSVKLVFALSMSASLVFAFILFRYVFNSFWSGLAGGLFFLFAPIRFINTYVSATFGNAVAFALLPLIFWSLTKASRGEFDRAALLGGSLSLAGLILSHNIMTLMFLPIIFAYALFLFFTTHHRPPALLLLGLGLSAFFLLPATLEKNLIRYDSILVDFYKTHFPSLKQLIRSPWGYGFSHPGTINDAMSFQIGLAHILVIVLSLIFLTRDKLSLFFSTAFFLSVFLMLEISLPLWQTIPFLPYLQMPWRLLAVSVFATSWLAAALVARSHFRFFTAIFFSALVIFSNRNHWHINQIFDPGEAYYLAINDTTTMASEHLPKGADKFNDFPPATTKISLLSGEANINYQLNQSAQVMTNITNNAPATIRFNQVYFPGWRYELDGQMVNGQFDASRPLPEFKLSPGTHRFVARFQRTPIRLIADIISLGSLFILIYALAFRRFSHLQRSQKPTRLFAKR